MQFPDSFLQNINQLLGNDAPNFFEALKSKSPVSIRLNNRKDISGYENNEKVLWNEAGRYLAERPVFTLDPAFHGGAYYVQEASSMFVAEAIKQTTDLTKPLMVMDLCAAPGGKTTTIASLLNDESIVVANEVIKSRVGVLKENLEKWGFPNYLVTNHDPVEMTELEGFFDVVLVDAPCSGEGLFRKDPNAIKEWSEESVQLCSARQKRILQAAAMLVKPQGVLIYSTCTYNESENNKNVDWLTKTNDFEVVKLNTPTEWKITNTTFGHQFYPHLTKGEGFFCAVLRKTDGEENYIQSRIKLYRLPSKYLETIKEWIENPGDFEFFLKTDQITVVALKRSLLENYGVLFRSLFKRSSGIEIGMFKGQDFIPSHALALSTIINKNVKSIEANKESSLKFLKKEDFEADFGDQGWTLVKFNGLSLGWVKVLAGRVNNYLPKEWRIRMDIED